MYELTTPVQQLNLSFDNEGLQKTLDVLTILALYQLFTCTISII